MRGSEPKDSRNSIHQDVPPPPKATTTCHITETCECLDCGKTTGAKSGRVRGTPPEPNLRGVDSRLLEEGYLRGRGRFTGKQVRDKILQDDHTACIGAVAAGLEPEARNMRDILKDADYIGYDEAPYPVMGKSGWARVAASHDTTSYHLAASAPGLH